MASRSIKKSEMRLPSFGWRDGQPDTATLYGAHYDRMQTVIAAARSGNALLIKLALDHHDQLGTSEKR